MIKVISHTILLKKSVSLIACPAIIGNYLVRHCGKATAYNAEP